jgi:hypothetical protein
MIHQSCAMYLMSSFIVPTSVMSAKIEASRISILAGCPSQPGISACTIDRGSEAPETCRWFGITGSNYPFSGIPFFFSSWETVSVGFAPLESQSGRAHLYGYFGRFFFRVVVTDDLDESPVSGKFGIGYYDTVERPAP